MITFYKIPKFIRKNSRSLTWNFFTKEKEIYLTFDDGPTPEITRKTLDILDKYNAKASFFCLGKNIKAFPEIASEIAKRGHIIGNHGYDHIRGWKVSTKVYLEDIDKAAGLIPAKLFRPPYGRIKPSQINALKHNYKIIMWSVLSADYNQNLTPERVYKNVVRNVFPGAIVVFHDSLKASKNLLPALPKILSTLAEQGYKFKLIQ